MTQRKRGDRVVIVGAGAAGLQAAYELADEGIASIVIDSSSQIGGVVNRGPLRSGGIGQFLSHKLRRTPRLLRERLKKYESLIELRLTTEVVGPMGEEKQLAVLSNQLTFESIHYDRLIICAGCYERATPFPGWTLPGVMMVGGTQLQLKSGLVRPGRRVVVCGSGPLVPVAASQLHRAGVEVVGLYEANSFRSIVRNALALFSNIPLFFEGVVTLARLAVGGVSMRYGWGIIEARGDGVLEEVMVAPYDRNWRPDHTRARVIKTDCLATGYGFVPRAELTQLLGVEHEPSVGGHLVPATDGFCRSSIDGIYVAGDVTGIQGGQVAVESGRMAAIACLEDMGVISGVESGAKIRRHITRIDRLRSFLKMFPNFSNPKEGLIDLATDDTIICRCENVTRAKLEEAVRQGVVDLTTLKMVTRAGMGDCQGKVCSPYCRSFLREKLNTDQIGELRPRFPLVPIPFGSMTVRAK